MIRLSGHVCSPPKVPDKRVFRITESPIGPCIEIGSRTFVRTSEISGLSEPGLTNHHCISFEAYLNRFEKVAVANENLVPAARENDPFYRSKNITFTSARIL